MRKTVDLENLNFWKCKIIWRILLGVVIVKECHCAKWCLCVNFDGIVMRNLFISFQSCCFRSLYGQAKSEVESPKLPASCFVQGEGHQKTITVHKSNFHLQHLLIFLANLAKILLHIYPHLIFPFHFRRNFIEKTAQTIVDVVALKMSRPSYLKN